MLATKKASRTARSTGFNGPRHMISLLATQIRPLIIVLLIICKTRSTVRLAHERIKVLAFRPKQPNTYIKSISIYRIEK